MIKPRAFFTLFFAARAALIILGIGFGTLAMPRVAAAQQDIYDDDVEDVSYLCDEGYDCQLESYSVIYDTSSPIELDMESDTYVNLDALDDGYDAYECTEVTQDSTVLGESCTGDTDGEGGSEQPAGFPLNSSQSDSYAVVTDSYLADIWDDPDACDDGDPDYCFEIAETGVDVTIGPVQITSVSPNGVDVGTSGSLTISGRDLVNPFGGSQPDVSATIAGNSTGLTLSSPSFNAQGTQGTVSYSAASNATTGLWSIGVSYSMGDPLVINNGVYGSFTVGYPPAVITNISPSTWTAGQQTSVTITGTGFGTAPTLSATAAGVTLTLNSANPAGTSIQATATVSATAPSETVSIQVQPGYTGSSYTCVCNGQPPDGTTTATVVPVTPKPQIMFNGANISGTSQNVYAGQQIPLSVTVPSPYAVQSQTWSFGNPTDVVAGYTATAASGSVSQVTTTNQNNLKFYFIAIGETETVTVNITCNNGQPSTASATFVIQGPTGNTQPQANLQNNATGTTVPSAQANPASLKMYNAPGQNNPNVGVWFKEPAPQPANAGRFIWVQILNSVTFSQIAVTNSGYSPPTGAANQLDGLYPYPSNADVAASGNPPVVAPSNLASDAPQRADLSGVLGEAAESFDASMYVLWDPALPAGCTPATVNTSTTPYTPNPGNCTSIPVPLGGSDWTWSACAINGLAAAGGGAHTNSWSVQCGAGTQSTYESSDYPTWNSCSKSVYGGC